MSELNFPNISPGDPWSSVSASAMMMLINEVRALSRMPAGPGLQVEKGGGGYIIRLDKATSPSGDATRSVVIVEEPVVDDMVLKVRGVMYERHPFTRDEFIWESDVFDAYPAPGVTPEEFVTQFWSGSEPPLSQDGKVLLAHMEEKEWMISLPSGGTALVVARHRDEDSIETTIDVSPVVIKADRSGWEITPSARFPIFCWPSLQRRDFARLAVPVGNTINRSTNVLSAQLIAGDWYLQQTTRMGFLKGDQLYQILDCTPELAL